MLDGPLTVALVPGSTSTLYLQQYSINGINNLVSAERFLSQGRFCVQLLSIYLLFRTIT